MVHKGYSRLINPEIAEGAISVDPRLHGLIIGPKGAVINALKQKTGVTLNFPGANSRSRRITLSGPKEGIKTAKKEIKFIAQYRYSPMINPGLTHEEIPVAENKMGIIIGPKASTRRHIEGNTKAKIHCPMRGDEKQGVIIVGTPDAVQRAKKAILKLINKTERKEEEEAEYKEYDEDEDEDQPDEYASQYIINTRAEVQEDPEEWAEAEAPAVSAAPEQGNWGAMASGQVSDDADWA